MYGLIKTVIRLATFVAMYTIALSYLLDWMPQIAEFFTVNGVPPVIITVLMCTISTLNWLFTPALIKIALTIWLILPSVKLSLYFSHKVATM